MANDDPTGGAKVLRLPSASVPVQLELKPNIDASKVLEIGRRLGELLGELGEALSDLGTACSSAAGDVREAFSAFEADLARQGEGS